MSPFDQLIAAFALVYAATIAAALGIRLLATFLAQRPPKPPHVGPEYIDRGCAFAVPLAIARPMRLAVSAEAATAPGSAATGSAVIASVGAAAISATEDRGGEVTAAPASEASGSEHPGHRRPPIGRASAMTRRASVAFGWWRL